MLRTRTVWGRAAAVLATTAVLSACGAGDEPTVSHPASAAVTVSTPPGRAVPAPVDGALRGHVPAIRDRGDGPEQVLVFGDSVAVLFADELAAELPATELRLDALDCRRLDRAFTGPCGGVPAGTSTPTGLDALRSTVARLDEEDARLDAAVVVLANNAALDADDLDAAMAVLASVPRVWWVTTDVDGRGWRDPNNALLHDLARRDPTAGVIDWFAAGAGKDWRADHVHPNATGQAALAELVADHLRCDCVP